VLFNPFEEQFYFPTAFVEQGNRQCWKLKVVSQKYQTLARSIYPIGIAVCVHVVNAAQLIRVMLDTRKVNQPDNLIAAHAAAWRNRTGFQALESEAGLSSSYKERRPAQNSKAFENRRSRDP
jgi:hypothetical protein